jgi:H+/Cl- antiporter ClcA
LLACGAAAGFASAYEAALSGAIFMAELVYGTLVIRRQFPSPHRTAAKLRPIRSACLIRVLTPGV